MLGRNRYALAAGLITLALLYYWARPSPEFRQQQQEEQQQGPHDQPSGNGVKASDWQNPSYFWSKIATDYPANGFQSLPTTPAKKLPKVQADFPKLPASSLEVRARRQQAVKDTFMRCWTSYKMYAWMSDELTPVSGGRRNPFGGWAATLVDSLDTLWIMGEKEEFDRAVAAIEKIDFAKTDLEEVNIFETTIRYLGGFLAAYDLSGGNNKILLRKAVEVGEMIYKAFDTPNRMPITRWDFHAAAKGEKQIAHSVVLLAEIGSLCMELTRLSIVTGDPKWFDASQRIMDELAEQQFSTLLPGQWPLVINAREGIFNEGGTFTLGAMADSTYEYLPKMVALMGGQIPAYQTMYEKAMDVALEQQLFRPMTPDNRDILISGSVGVTVDDGGTTYTLDSQGQHLVCFLGGMMALGGRLFSRQKDLDAAAKLTNGCIYTYEVFPHGIMPETFAMAPCASKDKCEWNADRWKQAVLAEREEGDDSSAETIIANERLPQGFTRIPDRRYILRPEAIESVFMMYRTTGKHEYAEHAWSMFESIRNVTQTELANAAVSDVTAKGKPPLSDSMESFWMGETLKYFYLTFSDPELINLDEWVFNTEAHPLRRLVKSGI